MIKRALENCMATAIRGGSDRYYLAFEISFTILKHSTVQGGVVSGEFFPYAKETMQCIGRQDCLVTILYTTVPSRDIPAYLSFFRAHGITFNYLNSNPEIGSDSYRSYDHKPYYDFCFDYKSGFEPFTDWKDVYDQFRLSG